MQKPTPLGIGTRRVVIVVWDGLRPDSVTEATTPTLFALRRRGVWFERSYCVFPSETRVNAASLATGAHPARNGIVGNTLFLPHVEPARPLDTGNHHDLEAIDRAAGPLVQADCLGQRLLAAGGSIAVVSSGSPGSSYLVNPLPPQPGTYLINRAIVRPEKLVPEVQRRFGPPPADQPHPPPVLSQAQNTWVTRVLADYVLPELQPTVAICWLRDPDTTQHNYGLGGPEALAALRTNDDLLATLLTALDGLGWADTTDVIFTSDHGFSSVAPDQQAALLYRLVDAGLKDSRQSTEVLVTGTAIYLAPQIAGRARAIVTWLQAQPWVGIILVRDDGPAAGLPGTLPISAVWGGGCHARCPDLQCPYRWTDAANDAAVPGSTVRRGGLATHGSASPYDMRNTLVAAGPSFRQGHTSSMPAGIVDVAPTVLALLGLPRLPEADGRVLHEVLTDGPTSGTECTEQEVQAETTLPDSASGGYRQRVRVARVGNTTYLIGGRAERDNAQ